MDSTLKGTKIIYQYLNKENNGTFPESQLIISDKGKEKIAINDNDNIKFIDYNNENSKTVKNKFALFTDKITIEKILQNYKAGKQFGNENLNIRSAFVALNRKPEKIKEWIGEKKRQEEKVNVFEKNEIPYEQLSKIGINKESLSKEDINNLLKGEKTSLKNINLNSENNELTNTPPFKINLEKKDNKVDAVLTFKKNELDFSKDNIGKTLTNEEQNQLKLYGTLPEPKFLTDNQGKSATYKIGVDTETNTLEKIDVKKFDVKSINDLKMTYNINMKKDQVNNLMSGKAVSLNNISLPGKKGSYNGKIDINPSTGKAQVLLKSLELSKKKTLIKTPLKNKEL